jgi:O-glycosyl hydrolase
MRRYKKILLLSAAALSLGSSAFAQSVSVVGFNPSLRYQTMMDFGASDCWTAEYVGSDFSKAEKERAARLLFSRETDAKGNPRGIGLSVWRVNLGAGSKGQGEDSNIADATRRTDCFLQADGTYDWSRCPGQQWFMQQAKAYGVDHFLLFSNSAPVYFTANGLANNKDGAHGANLKSDFYDDFASYIATTARHFADEGYPITYVDPVNEPAFDWRDGQEGSPWLNAEISHIVRELDKALDEQKLDKVSIVMPEASAWDRTYQLCTDYGGRASDQIEAFWNPARTATYIGDLKHVEKAVGGHDYWTFGSDATLVDVRKKVDEKAKKYGLKVMQTEWSMLDREPGTDTGFPASYEKAGEMDIALFMGKLIHIGLTQGNMSSWSYWTAMSQVQYSQKNRFELLRLNASGDTGYESYGSLTKGGTVAANPNLWVLGNYSLFIRPGYQRIAMTGTPVDDIDGLMATAFLSPDGKRVVAVFVNNAAEVKTVRFNTSATSIRKYITDSTHTLDLDPSLRTQPDSTKVITIPKRSVVTFTFDGAFTTAIQNVHADKTETQPVYSLSGVRLSDNLSQLGSHYHGVCVVGGKKIVR